jgi:hypothetical protein
MVHFELLKNEVTKLEKCQKEKIQSKDRYFTYNLLVAEHSPIQIKKYEMGVYVGRMGDMRNTFKILVRKPEGKRPLERS